MHEEAACGRLFFLRSGFGLSTAQSGSIWQTVLSGSREISDFTDFQETRRQLSQDCHGDIAQVDDDFSRFVTPENPGDFRLAGDFYTKPDTLRVPWANEPGCGSCHTGDATKNMHGDPGTVGQPDDGLGLMQACRSADPVACAVCFRSTPLQC